MTAVRHTARPVLLAGLAALALVVGLTAGPADATPATPAAPASSSTPALDRPCDVTPEQPGQARCLVVQRPAGTAPAPGQATPAASTDLTPAGWQNVYGVNGMTPPAGATVGIVVAYDAPNLFSDLRTYRASYGLPACTTGNGCYSKIDQRGSVIPEGGAGTGPAPNSGWALETTLDTQAVSAVCPGCRLVVVEADSASFSDLGQALLTAQRAGATVIGNSFGGLESSGGNGVPSTSSIDQTYWSQVQVPVFAATGDDSWNNLGDTSAGAVRGPMYPATSPSVVAVGGTSGVPAANGSGQRAWLGAGSGCSYVFGRPAPQSAYFAALGTAPGTDAACANAFPRKAEADLSALADPNSPGFRVYQRGNANGDWSYVGGTSLSAQLVAAVAAYAGPRPTGSSVTDVAWRLAAAGATRTGLADVTTGTNDPSGTCGGQRVCSATFGWDGPTGLGTPRSPALFAPLLTSSATTALPGASLTASGSNLVPGETATLTSGSTTIGTAVVSGAGTWSLPFTVPLGATTSYPLTVTGSGSSLTATVTLTVPAATLTASPASLAPGQTFTATAANMSPSEQVTFGADGNDPVTVTADQNGTATTTFTVPATTSATSLHLTAVGGSTGLSLATDVPVVPAALAPVPAQVAPGANLGLQGSGFPVGSTVTFTATGAPAPTAPTTVGSDGTFTASVTVPTSGTTTVTVTATAGGRSATATATVPDAVVTLPSSLPAGASATLAGAFFQAGEPVTVAVGSSRQLTAPTSATAAADGSVAVPVSVPGNACPATTTVTVTGTTSGRTATTSVTVPPGQGLAAGCSVNGGTTFTSPSGQYRLVVQGDGNLVLYGAGGAVWSTATFGSAPFLIVQGDGNVVLYAGGRALWSSGTAGAGAGGRLVLQDDGNLVVYDGTGRARWARGLGGTDRLPRGGSLQPGWFLQPGNGAYRLVMQGDGNLVLYTSAGSPAWSSRTSGVPALAAMQGDGNFVVYAGGRAGFATGTAGRGQVIVVQTDGNLVVYDGSGRAVWAR